MLLKVKVLDTTFTTYRTKCSFTYLIPADADDLFEQFSILRGELKTYNPELLDKNYVIGISKSDLLDDELQQEMKTLAEKTFPDDDVLFFISRSKGFNATQRPLWDALNT